MELSSPMLEEPLYFSKESPPPHTHLGVTADEAIK